MTCLLSQAVLLHDISYDYVNTGSKAYTTSVWTTAEIRSNLNLAAYIFDFISKLYIA
jgi:hypothetical protein